MKRWYAVHTLQFKELLAERHLRQQGFSTFVPKMRKTVRHARRMQQVVRPYFPRYIFVAIDLDTDQWRRVNGTVGVCGLVMHGLRPAPLPIGLVEDLCAMSDVSGVLKANADIRVGGDVRLISGALVDQTGELLELSETGRVRILLEMMGAKVPVISEVEAVIAA